MLLTFRLIPTALIGLLGVHLSGCDSPVESGGGPSGSGEAIQHTLTIASGGGTGDGSVSGSGIDCALSGARTSGTCSQSFNSGTVVTLAASPAAGHSFTGWTGSCDGTGACVVTMSQARSVTARFTAPVATYTIHTSANPANGGATSGGGTFTAAQFPVTVTATANAGFRFANWTEGGNIVSTSASFQIATAGNRTLVANFTADPGDPITYISCSSLSGAGSFSNPLVIGTITGTTVVEGCAPLSSGEGFNVRYFRITLAGPRSSGAVAGAVVTLTEAIPSAVHPRLATTGGFTLLTSSSHGFWVGDPNSPGDVGRFIPLTSIPAGTYMLGMEKLDSPLRSLVTPPFDIVIIP